MARRALLLNPQTQTELISVWVGNVTFTFHNFVSFQTLTFSYKILTSPEPVSGMAHFLSARSSLVASLEAAWWLVAWPKCIYNHKYNIVESKGTSEGGFSLTRQALMQYLSLFCGWDECPWPPIHNFGCRRWCPFPWCVEQGLGSWLCCWVVHFGLPPH